MMERTEAWSKLKTAWALSSGLHSIRPGASDAELSAFEATSGLDLPSEWRELYRFADGAYLLEGNVQLYPRKGEPFSLLHSSGAHLSWDWNIPDELRLAGDNGAGDVFGLWLPTRNASTGSVVQMGEIFESGCLAIAATSLLPFLMARSAYYLLLLGGRPEALDALSLPQNLGTRDMDERTWRAILQWADPRRPSASDNPFVARQNVASVNDALMGDG